MAGVQWQKAKEIFNEALELPPDKRLQFLSEACGGDEETHCEIKSLLFSFDNAKSFMEMPAVGDIGNSFIESKTLKEGFTFGHYEIIKQIGTGGMGEVYLAQDKKLDRQVAVKILNEKFSQDESNLKRFIHEAKAASSLNHPNILVIYEIRETDETHYLVSEFIEGKTLREVLQDNNLKLSEILDISIQIANALLAAHEARLVHRDIKPENIMIRPDGFVKVLDFGLAKLVEQKNKSILGLKATTAKQNQTADGVILGTINYMSPEQAKGKRVDERTDIFSFGVVIYEMIATKTPFAGDSMSETFANLLNAEPQPLSSFSANIPNELQRIVTKMLRKNKDERYQTIKDVLTDLKDLQKRIVFEVEFGRTVQPNKKAEVNMQIVETEFFERILSLPTNNLSQNFSPIIGREKEISHIKNLLLKNDVRLVTMVGVGGIGKTRLAKAVAQEMLQDFPDGVFFVELAAITNPELVVSTINQLIGVKESVDKQILEALKDYLRTRKLLLVIDNFEQVVSAASQIAELLATAAKLKILITSRELLHLSAEREFVVSPLTVPDVVSKISFGELSNYAAIELFVERARNAKPNFALTNENVNNVVEICDRLDGLPLAIELAAARTKILSPQAILTKLRNRLKLLTGGASDLPARQQTMRGTIEWSYNLLTENEKCLFRWLAVFVGGFTFEAAEAVCSNYSLQIADYKSDEAHRLKTADQFEVLDLLTSLVDKNLLVSKTQADDEQRFRMLETVREYALESLEKNNETKMTHSSHATYFLALGEEACLYLQSAKAGEWLTRLENEHENLRAAIRWLFENDEEKAARLAAAIRIYLINHCHLAEGREWLERVLERGDGLPADVRFKLLNGLGYLAVNQGDNETARKMFEKDLVEGKTSGDKKRIAESLRGLGVVAHSQGDYKATRKFHEEGLAIHRKLSDKFGIACSLNGLGCLALGEGDSATAHTLFEESLTNFRLVGNESGICYCLLNLGLVAHSRSDYVGAQEYYSEVITIAQNLGYKDRVCSCLEGFAALTIKHQEWELGVRLAGAAENLRESIGSQMSPDERRFRDTYLVELKSQIEEADFAELYEQGRKLKLDEAIALALKEYSQEVKTSVINTHRKNKDDSIQTSIPKPANAYQAYQLARYHFQQLSPTDIIKSRSLLEEAVSFDADFAVAHAALAEQSVMEGMLGFHPPIEIFPKAKEALRRAAELNPNSTEFYTAAGFIDLICDWNFAPAEKNLRKALELNPHNALANNYLGQTFMFQCQPEEAEFYLRRAVKIEPLTFSSGVVLSIAYFLGRDYQKAIAECERMLAVYPIFFNALWMRCFCWEQTGKAAEAIAEYEKILREQPNGELIRRWMGYAYALVGDTENALATAARVETERQQAHFVSPTHLAALYAALKDTDKAISYLEDALEKRDPWMLWIAADPRFDNLRSDRRFNELVKRVGFK